MSQSLRVLFEETLQFVEHPGQPVEQNHAEVGRVTQLAELAEGFPIVTWFFYSSSNFGVKKKSAELGGFFCAELDAFNEKKVAFLNILMFISVG